MFCYVMLSQDNPMVANLKFGSALVGLVCIAVGCMTGNASAISGEVGRKCAALTAKAFPPKVPGIPAAGRSPHTELLIVGDTFGLWELTLVEGIEKLDHIITAHQAIFDQLRATSARIKVTMMVGNHDYDLACNPDFAAQLKVYNIRLDKSLVQQDARSARRNQDRG
jgi:hypothetical protein